MAQRYATKSVHLRPETHKRLAIFAMKNQTSKEKALDMAIIHFLEKGEITEASRPQFRF